MLTLDDVQIDLEGFRLAANWTVPEGARVAVLGPSGSGKSTLLGAIAGFVPLDQGRISVAGDDITALAPMRRPLSILFQDNNLFPHLTAFQNVALGVSPTLKLTEAQKARVQDALGSVGLADFAQRKPAHLSGGQQSRVGVARLLVRGRPLALLDEPFAALGPAMRGEMIALVQRLEATVLMVTHDVTDAKRFASHVIWIEDGVVQAPREIDAFFADPPAGLSDYTG